MIGLILCGGQSKRMGNDKGLLFYQGQTWASIAAKKLHELKLQVKFSVNSQQELIYKKLFRQNDLILDREDLVVGGPLKGVLSAHLAFPDKDLVVLACDLILMESILLKKLIEDRKKSDAFDAHVYSRAEFYEPLCGIYTAKGLAKIANLYLNGKLEKHSMQFVLSHLLTAKTVLTVNDVRYFANFNSPTELEGL
jgi:molybdopterin-guanine dinucleotide biosynthesis protein A